MVFERAFALETAGRDVLTLLDDLIPRLTILLALRREDAGAALAMQPPELLPLAPGLDPGIEPGARAA